MASTSELLSNYGLTMQEARDFVYANISTPENIYSAAAQYGITFDMLAEIYGQGATGEVVKEFLGNQGLVSSGAAPYWDKGYLEGDFTSMYKANQTEAMQSWGQVINDYRAGLALKDFEVYGTTFVQVDKEVDWLSFQTTFEAFDSLYGSNDTWKDSIEETLNTAVIATIWEDLGGKDYEDTWSMILPLDEWGIDEATFVSTLGLTEASLDLVMTLPEEDWVSYYRDIARPFAEAGLFGENVHIEGQSQPEQIVAVADLPMALEDVQDVQLVGVSFIDDGAIM